MVFRIRRRIKDLLFDMHLREKLILTFLLFGFLPMLVFGIIQLNLVIKNLQEQTEKETAISLNQMAQRIDDRLNTYNLIANGVVYDPRLITMLGADYDDLGDTIDLYHYVWNELLAITKINPEVQGVTVYTPNKDLITAKPYLVRLNSFDDIIKYPSIKTAAVKPYLGGIRERSRKNDYWMGDEGQGGLLFSLNRTITQPNMMNRTLGILTLSISEDALFTLIHTNSQHTVTLIVDDDGNIVSATDRTLVGKPVIKLVPFDSWQRADGGSVFYKSEAGEMHLMAMDLNWGWRLATVISMRDVQASVRGIQFGSFIATLLCALLAIVSVGYISNFTAQRFRLLLNKFTLSETAVPQPGLPIKGRDEIGLLDQSFREMTDSLNHAIHDLYQVELEKREAQLVALQSRINPHFLYNTLSMIGWMTQTHTPQQVRHAIEILATYYRVSLSGGRDVITLREELDGLQAYLAIQKMRAGGHVKATIAVDPVLDGIMLPKMTLQPIVENCIEHGLDEQHQTVSIMICSSVLADAVLIHICDDGAGIEETKLEQIRVGSYRSTGGYGIQNVQMRLKLHFGESFGLSIENEPQGGTRVTVRIPFPDE